MTSSSTSSDTIGGPISNNSNTLSQDLRKVKKRPPPKTSPSRLPSFSYTIFGWLFDGLQLSLSVIDAISDALVTYEFYSTGQTSFFYATFILLLLGCISDAVAFLVSLEKHFSISKWYAWVFYTALLTPFSIFLPVTSYFLQFSSWKSSDFAEYVPWNKKDDMYGNTRKKSDTENGDEDNDDEEANFRRLNNPDDAGDAARELHKKAYDHGPLIAIDEFVASRQAKFWCANVHTVTASAPQTLVQLINISCNAAPTKLQVFSLSLSLVGVASKLFQVCRSHVPSAFFAKLAFAVHDLFSIAFLFSSLFSVNVPKEYTFLGLEVCGLTWWLLFIKLSNVVIISFMMLVLALHHEAYQEKNCNAKLKIVLLIILYCFVIVPVAIIQESVKLSWYLALTLAYQPSSHQIPHMPLLHEFLWGGSGEMKRQWVDWKKTFKKFEQFVTDKVEKVQNKLIEKNVLLPNGSFNQGPRSQGNQFRQQSTEIRAELAIPFPSTVRQLTQPLLASDSSSEDNFVDLLENNNNGDHDDVMSKEENKKIRGIINQSKNEEPLLTCPDSFFARALHCLRIAHCLKLTNSPRHFDVYTHYYNRDNALLQRIKTQIDDAVDSHEHYNKLQLTHQNHKSLSFFDFWYIMLAPVRYLKTTRNPNSSMSRQAARDRNRTQRNQCARSLSQNVAPIVSICMIVVLTAATSIFGLLYPILFAYYYFDTMQLIQSVCFYPAIISLIFSIILAPAAYRYLLTDLIFTKFLDFSVDPIGVAVDSYFSVPKTVIRAVACPDSVIPADCFDNHVLQFLDLKQVKLYGLYGKELEEMRKMKTGKLI